MSLPGARPREPLGARPRGCPTASTVSASSRFPCPTRLTVSRSLGPRGPLAIIAHTLALLIPIKAGILHCTDQRGFRSAFRLLACREEIDARPGLGAGASRPRSPGARPGGAKARPERGQETRLALAPAWRHPAPTAAPTSRPQCPQHTGGPCEAQLAMRGAALCAGARGWGPAPRRLA